MVAAIKTRSALILKDLSKYEISRFVHIYLFDSLISITVSLSSVSAMLDSVAMAILVRISMNAPTTQRYVRMANVSIILAHSDVNAKWDSCIQMSAMNSLVSVCSEIS